MKTFLYEFDNIFLNTKIQSDFVDLCNNQLTSYKIYNST